jgi:AraC-like DNA-binding protein
MQPRHEPRAGEGSPSERLMWIDDDRVFYAGLLGVPSVRAFGALCIYVSLRGDVRVSLQDAAWQTCRMAVVPPYLPHRVECSERLIGVLYVEPESVDAERLPDALRRGLGAVDEPALVERIRGVYRGLRDGAPGAELTSATFDLRMWGTELPGRVLEPRVRQVVDAIRRDPRGRFPAVECAASVDLSSWRFLHLFKAEMGVPFRTFRSWKRARCLLHYVTRDASMVEVALEVGYPDASHFSRSIRQFYGLSPKDIFAGSRKLRLHGRMPGGESG